jgi:hypothetical protein
MNNFGGFKTYVLEFMWTFCEYYYTHDVVFSLYIVEMSFAGYTTYMTLIEQDNKWNQWTSWYMK